MYLLFIHWSSVLCRLTWNSDANRRDQVFKGEIGRDSCASQNTLVHCRHFQGALQALFAQSDLNKPRKF